MASLQATSINGNLTKYGNNIYAGSRLLTFTVAQASQTNQYHRIATFVPSTDPAKSSQGSGGYMQNILLRICANPDGNQSNAGNVALVSITTAHWGDPANITVLDHYIYGGMLFTKIRVSKENADPYRWYVDIYVTNQVAGKTDNFIVEALEGGITLGFTANVSVGYNPSEVTLASSGFLPLKAAGTSLITNLNADLLDGYNPATTNTANTIVLRDASGNFSAGTITASLSGNASTASNVAWSGITSKPTTLSGFGITDAIDTSSTSQTKTGVFQSNASLRAPVFYDSNDTNYYLDPASTSILNNLTTGGIKGDSGTNYPHSFTNTDSGNTHWTNRNDRLLTSNGTNWATDGRDPIMALVTSGNSNATTIANSIGLALHNESATDNTFSPAIVFSNKSNSASYNTAYAAIIGRKTGQGVDSNWSAGELHFYTMPVGGYVSNIPSLIIDSAGEVGIGTTSPATKLQIGTGTPTSATDGIQFGNDTSARLYRSGSGIIQSSGGFVSSSYLYSTTFLQAGNNNIYPNGYTNTLILNSGNSAGNSWVTTLAIAPGGNVGIEVTSPTAKLDIAGSNTNGYSLLLRSGDALNGTDSVQIGFGYNNTTDYRHSIRTRHNSAASAGNNIDFYLWKYGTDSASTLGSQFVMTLQGNGNVGIGVTSPTALLDVVTATASSTALSVRGTNGTLLSVIDDLNDSLLSVNNSAGLPVLEVFADDRVVMGQYGQNDLVVRNNKVGIGVLNPAQKLEVNSATATVGFGARIGETRIGTWIGNTGYAFFAHQSVADTSGSYSLIQGSDGTSFLNSASTRNLYFRIGNSDRMMLNSSGNLGIGTTSPATTLQIGQLTPTSATAGLQFGDDTGTRIYRSASSTLTMGGTFVATTFSGSGASLTNLPAGQLSGTIPSGVLGNSTVYIGTTAILLNRASASQSLTGITSIDGYSASSTRMGSWDGTTFNSGSNSLASSGGRATNLNPNTYQQSISFEFKNGSFSTISGNYSGLITIAPWYGTTASTGDPNYQLLFSPAAANSTNPPVLQLRAGIDTTWGSWSTILHSSNYNSYAPTLTGTGASGTWGISITGASGTITSRTLWGQTYNGSADVSGNLTSVGNITGSSAITITAGGSNQNVTVTPSGTGYTLLNGNVGVGTSTPAYKLDVNGACHASSFPTSSDARFKKNIKPIQNSLDKICKINGVIYEWNEFIHARRDGYDINTPIIGVIAQDLEKVLPEVVSKWSLSEDCSDARAVDYIRIIPVLIEAIKELNNKNSILEARILALENKQ